MVSNYLSNQCKVDFCIVSIAEYYSKSQISITLNNCISRFLIGYNSIGEIEEERLTFNTQFTHVSTHLKKLKSKTKI